ncbi:PREDICTED: scarecrow-like protein 30 [Ipomoea nil]|uniref:scarecrow-like protein 30 n=1 Tax=Ipomoea nil TaxID=35883 RepID=UPI0009014A86|nr:PREDICTED: scarecrow-like protein 30 [Ipomoea nil]
MDRFDSGDDDGSNYNHQFTSSSSSSSSGDVSIESSSCGGDDSTPLERDYFDGVLKYINQMLMEEEDLENRPCMLQDSLALQAAEKSFYEALTDCNFSETNRKRDSYGDGDLEAGRDSKQVAGSTAEEPEQTEMYDKTLLCSANNPGFYSDPPWCHLDHSTEQKRRFKPVNDVRSRRGRPRAGENRVIGPGKPVDLRSLLLESAVAAANYDGRTATHRLNLIRQHSSPHGDAAERTAHYFANSLEARLAGTGPELYTSFSRRRRMSAAEVLKAYQAYVTACPFKKMSNIFANKTIGKLTGKATAIHIIDFGILYGFQWPCFIQGISLRPSGPPKLHITGIDFPQPGFRPAERVEDTGRRLANYCKRFNVPFEYTAIAKKWDTISLDELNMDRDRDREEEVLIVNCLYRLKNTPDETLILDNSPRDTVLNLINQINPDFFIHGVINGTYNSSFFTSRFKEALFHFSSLFDMFESTIPREDQERLVYEEEIWGRDIMNIVACEGTERVERPETYKQWQLRNQRAGFKQVGLNQDVIKEVRAKVRLRYHKDFLVDEHSDWMLQGWKGRVLCALSCWTPVEKAMTGSEFVRSDLRI